MQAEDIAQGSEATAERGSRWQERRYPCPDRWAPQKVTCDQKSRIWKEEEQREEAMQNKILQRPIWLYHFLWSLFEQSRSGCLNVPCEVLEDELNKTYSDPDRAVTLPAVERLVRPAGMACLTSCWWKCPKVLKGLPCMSYICNSISSISMA